MKNSPYFLKSKLLLKILPLIRPEDNFALKGGTALNFFVQNLPRLSVDIDLTYLPIEERAVTLSNISKSMENIEKRVKNFLPGAVINKKLLGANINKMAVLLDNQEVKIEPNTIIRGSVFESVSLKLCEQAVNIFETDLSIKCLQKEELYAGKICAALDRQHPRDLFDVKLFLDNEGFSEKTRKAFLVYLISHNRPIIELLDPACLDISKLYNQEFRDMTIVNIPIEELIEARSNLISSIRSTLTDSDKEFLLSFKQGKPNWSLLGVSGIDLLPAVKWKLSNINKMGEEKHLLAFNKLNNFFNNLK